MWQILVFLLTAGAVFYAGLRGGSFDLVVRQEEGVFVGWVLGVAILAGVIPRARPPAAIMVALGMLFALGIWTALSFGWSSSDERTLIEVTRILLIAGAITLVVITVDRRVWHAAAAGLAVGACALCTLAVAARLAPDAFPADVVARAFDTSRLGYPLDYWNATAAFGAMSMALALASSAHASRIWARAAALAMVPLCALTVYLAYSRAGVGDVVVALAVVLAFSSHRWLTLLHAFVAAAGTALVIITVRGQEAIAEGTSGEGAGAVVLALLVAALICVTAALLGARLRLDQRRLAPRRARIAIVVGAVAAIAAVLVVAVPRADDVWADFKTTEAEARSLETDDPAARLGDLHGTRYLIWKSALRAFESEPARGIGAGSFEFWWNQDERGEYLVDAHSLYLEQLAELGIPGLLFIGLFLGALAVAALRARQRSSDDAMRGIHAGLLGAFAVFLLHAGVDWMWESTAVALLGLVAVSLAASLGAHEAGPLPWRWRVPAAVAALIFVLVQLPGLASTSLVRESQAALRANDPAEASRLATDAVESEPWAATPYVQRALVAEELGDLGAARRDLQRAIEREPDNWRHRLLLARVEAERGQVDEALSAFRRARDLRPASSFFGEPDPD